MEENLLPPRDLKFSSARTEMYAVFSHPALLHSFFLPSSKTKHIRIHLQLFSMFRHKSPIPGICKNRTAALMYFVDHICTFFLRLRKVEVCLRPFLRHTIHDVSCGRNPRIGMQRFPVCSVNVQFQVHRFLLPLFHCSTQENPCHFSVRIPLLPEPALSSKFILKDKHSANEFRFFFKNIPPLSLIKRTFPYLIIFP